MIESDNNIPKLMTDYLFSRRVFAFFSLAPQDVANVPGLKLSLKNCVNKLQRQNTLGSDTYIERNCARSDKCSKTKAGNAIGDSPGGLQLRCSHIHWYKLHLRKIQQYSMMLIIFLIFLFLFHFIFNHLKVYRKKYGKRKTTNKTL